MLGIFSTAFNLAARTDDWGQAPAPSASQTSATSETTATPRRKRLAFTLSALD